MFQVLTVYNALSMEDNLVQARQLESNFRLQMREFCLGHTDQPPRALPPLVNEFGALCPAYLFRDLIFSQKGYIGMAPKGVEPGDLICILYGGRVPFILRDVSSKIPHNEKFGARPYYKVVGDSYIHGIMMGEALDLMEEQGLKEQEFLLL
jgi:hypothetical protein